MKSSIAKLIVTLFSCAFATPARADVLSMPPGQASVTFVTVGDAGNVADPATGYGAVTHVFKMDQYDVTAAQYAQFLNAVAATDTYGLYTNEMGTSLGAGITRNGSSGSYTYLVTTGHENFPVIYASWGDAARFTNWLQNGQHTGAEGPGTTETGAYTLNGAVTGAALMAITRNVGAQYFIPTEDEWYKAAYYSGGGLNSHYYAYPTSSDTPPINTLSATSPDHANFYDHYNTGNGGYTDPINYLTPVGAFAASPSPYGTFDQGGDLYQWNETAVGTSRVVRGASFDQVSTDMASSIRFNDDPSSTNAEGFRVASVPDVASVPEPASVALFAYAVAGLGLYRCARKR
jgi:sulfatase modifying factor 1